MLIRHCYQRTLSKLLAPFEVWKRVKRSAVQLATAWYGVMQLYSLQGLDLQSGGLF